jgi:hypothetical protein
MERKDARKVANNEKTDNERISGISETKKRKKATNP